MYQIQSKIKHILHKLEKNTYKQEKKMKYIKISLKKN